MEKSSTNFPFFSMFFLVFLQIRYVEKGIARMKTIVVSLVFALLVSAVTPVYAVSLHVEDWKPSWESIPWWGHPMRGEVYHLVEIFNEKIKGSSKTGLILELLGLAGAIILTSILWVISIVVSFVIWIILNIAWFIALAIFVW